jgi:hypothetical protein
LDKKQLYHKPLLRKVRLEVKTSVLGVCNTTSNLTPKSLPTPTTCAINNCYTPH